MDWVLAVIMGGLLHAARATEAAGLRAQRGTRPPPTARARISTKPRATRAPRRTPAQTPARARPAAPAPRVGGGAAAGAGGPAPPPPRRSSWARPDNAV